MRQIKNKKLLHVALAAFMSVSSLTTLAITEHASAAALGQVLIRFDRMKQSQGTTGTVCAKPTSTATEAKVVVTFPTGFTLGAFGTFTVDTTSTNMAWPSGASAWPSIAAPTGAGDISGQAVTFGSGDLTPGTLYCFNWNDATAVTEPSSPGASESGSVKTQTNVPADIDTAEYSTATIADDQVVVTATVPTAFSFALSGNTDALGNLSTSAPVASPTPRTATVNTNAKNGWVVWAKDASAGLASSTASYTIPTSCTSGASAAIATLSAGNEGYNTGVTKSQVGGSGTISLNAAFDNTAATAYRGGGLCTNFQSIATSTGSADTAVLTFTNNASIKGSTPAATDYTDTITIVGAGLF